MQRWSREPRDDNWDGFIDPEYEYLFEEDDSDLDQFDDVLDSPEYLEKQTRKHEAARECQDVKESEL